MNTNQQLIAEIEAYAATTGIAVSTLCKRAAGNSELVERMKRGGSVTLTVADRIRSYMAANPRPNDFMPESKKRVRLSQREASRAA